MGLSSLQSNQHCPSFLHMGQRHGGSPIWSRHLFNGLVASFEAGLTLTHFPAPQTIEPCEKSASCIWHVAWSLLNFGSFVLLFKDLEGCFNYIPLRVLRAIAKFFGTLISYLWAVVRQRAGVSTIAPHLSQLMGRDRLAVAFERPE